MLAQETVDQVKSHPDIVGIISDYVQLRKRGRNYIGLCPFHSEKTPSFTVSAEKQLWHCFGCHESGNHIGFVMKMDNLSFGEAVKHIAEKVGIPIVEKEKSNAQMNADQEYDAMRDMLYFAREKFTSFLTPDSEAYHYLTRRGLTEKSIRDFHLGFSAPAFNLAAFLREKNFSDERIAKSGMAFRNEQGLLISRFRNRVVFPILDHQGRTVGFSGRHLAAQSDGPKYVNSEDTPLFAKRKLLYAFDRAKNAIKKEAKVIIMEGYMDVIMAHQFGFQNAVATMGTALSAEHAQRLSRFTSNVFLAMDSDEAGQKAIERSFEILQSAAMKTHVVNLGAKDPADMLLAGGADEFQKSLDDAKPMIEFIFERTLKKFDANKIEQVPEILGVVTPILRMENDAVIVRHYVKMIAAKLKIDEELVMAKIKKTLYNVRNQLFISSRNKKTKYQKAEERLLYFMASDEKMRRQIIDQDAKNAFLSEDGKLLFSILENSTGINQEIAEKISDDRLKKILCRILIEGESEWGAGEPNEWQQCLSVLKSHKTEKRVDELKNQLKAMEKEGNEEAIVSLLQELHDLMKAPFKEE